jgi:ABC-type nitrate/sulfonate/bicarbonate transport system substrate-binding protein
MGIFAMSLALTAAQAKGFYAQQNLSVQYAQVNSSTSQFASLRDNQYDVIQTAADNVANYRLNNSNSLGATINVQMIDGLDYGLGLTLVARPGITSAEALRGKTLSVDAPNSGFAYVLYKILSSHGLEQGRDYQVVSSGGTLNRFGLLLAGKVDGTLLNNGFEVRAAYQGQTLLDTVYSVVNPYLGSTIAAKQEWLESHRDVAVRLIRAYYDAVQWSFDPNNQEEAIGLLMAQPNTPRDLAEQIYAEQLRWGQGIIPDANIDRHALLNVLKLRAQFNGFDEPQNLRYLASPASGLYDLSYYYQALRDVWGYKRGHEARL